MDVYLHLIGQGLAIGLLTGILYVLIALGLTLIYGILHIVNFAHGEIYMLGAMGVFYCYVVFKLPFAATLVVILLLSLLLGLGVERAFFRPLRGQWLQLVVASVGLSLIIQSLGWIAFGIALAALAGAFVAPIYSLNPGMGLEAILMSFLIIIVGGLGSITGTVLAGLLVGVLQSVGGVLLGAEAAYGLVFIVMIVVLVVRPAGLLGKA